MGRGEGSLGGRRQAPKESISYEGRVTGAPSLAPKVIHFALGEGLRGGEGYPPLSHTAPSISHRGEGQARGGSAWPSWLLIRPI